MSKNLFDYAKKELSQDAFLMYIIDCYNSENKTERSISRKFINFLVGLSEDEEITKIWLKAQWHKIDISVYFYTKNQIIALFIEDKTTSEEHNQLMSYTDSIKKALEHDKTKPTLVKKLFYKTNTIDQHERKRINEAGWEEVSFDRIHDFWKQFINVNHMITSQYAQHIDSIYNDTKNTEIPKDNNLIAWLSFFRKVVEPVFADKVICWSGYTIYNYVYLCFRTKKDEKAPYLEIRSRDCLGNNFNAKILTYGVEFKNENINGLEEIRKRIKAKEKNNVFKGNYGQKQNKQVAHTEKGRFKVSSNEDFIEKVKIVLDEYLDIISFWK